ncbi:MAG: HipA domain-containing protein [Lachnospiraceae bacterium]|nr:HipA domain-containing protein [Lachnospiraceae bacterium]
MVKYQISLEHGAEWIPVGTITGENSESAVFRYEASYLEASPAGPISVSLPLQREAFSAARTRTFFNGLLPEGFTRRAVAAWMRTDEDDYLGILYGLGRECLGALRISREGERPGEAYEALSMEEVRALAAEGASKSAELVAQSHLSLTGATGKAGLYYKADRDRWYLPVGTAPSTHIVKQSHIRFQDIVTNEQLSQRTAYHLGIAVPESFIVNTGRGQEDEILFATKRFDRFVRDGGPKVDGLPRPQRLHQENLAQALGIPSSAKYEADPSQGYMRQMFSLLRRVSANPVEDQLKLWDRIVFAWLLGNTDAHIKNYSLLYSPDLKGIRLSPAYDMLSTCLYTNSTRTMAFSIGGEPDIRNVTDDSFRLAAKDAGLGEKLAMARLAEMRERFPGALLAAAGELEEAGFQRAGMLAEKIGKKANW